MAEENLSPESQVIVDRLVREGELLRNKEDRSNKSIKETLLDKFAPVLDQISINTTQTAKSLGVAEAAAAGNTEKLETLGEEIAKMNADEKKALEEKLKKEREDAIKKKESDRENMIGFGNISKNLKSGFEGLKSGFKAIKEDPLGSLMNIGKWALILPLVAGAAKGLLDSIFGEDSVITFFKDIYDSPFMKLVRNHPWASLGTALLAMAAVNWTQMYLSMMAAARTMGVRNVPTVVPGTPGKPGGPAGPPAPKGTGLKNGLRNFLKMGRGKGLYVTLAASGALMLLGGEDDIDMEAELNNINRDLNKEEQKAKDEMLTNFENERRGLGTIITNTLGGAAVGGATGAVFGGVGALPGALFGAIGGLFTGIGEVAWDAYDDYKNDIDELPNQLEEMLKNEESEMYNKGPRGRRGSKKTDAEIKANAEKINKDIEGIITGLREQIYGKDGVGGIADEVTQLEALLAEGPNTSFKRGRNRKVKGYLFNGRSYTEDEFKKLVEDQKRERVIREKQLAASERMLELRRGEAETVEKLNESEENLAEVNKDTADKKAAGTDIEPETTARDRRQTIASGGFALNIVNNYYNKGGDTVVSNQSDNRVSSNKSTGVVMAGPGGGSAFSASMPNGAA
jgi:hypothetical protein